MFTEASPDFSHILKRVRLSCAIDCVEGGVVEQRFVKKFVSAICDRS